MPKDGSEFGDLIELQFGELIDMPGRLLKTPGRRLVSCLLWLAAADEGEGTGSTRAFRSRPRF